MSVRVFPVYGLLLAALAPASPETLEALLNQAVAAQRAGDGETAIRLYKEVLRQQPGLGEVRSNLGAALVQQGKFPEAIAEYEVALKKLPDNPSISRNLALAHYKLGNFREAARLLEPFQRLPAGNLQIALLLADCWSQLGQSAKVVDLLNPLRESHPEDRTMAWLLGTALLNQGQTDQAQVLLDRILRDGDSAETQLLLGASKMRARQFDTAVENLKRAVELNPNLPAVHAYYGRALKASGDAPGAMREFRAELARNPYDFTSNLELSFLLKEDGTIDEAKKFLDAALRVRPEDPAALYQVASIHLLEAKNEQARLELERIVQRTPTFIEAQVSLATAYYRLKRREDGDRVRLVVRKLQEEEQSRQPGVRPAKERQ